MNPAKPEHAGEAEHAFGVKFPGRPVPYRGGKTAPLALLQNPELLTEFPGSVAHPALAISRVVFLQFFPQSSEPPMNPALSTGRISRNHNDPPVRSTAPAS
jgi:hypothetical protein